MLLFSLHSSHDQNFDLLSLDFFAVVRPGEKARFLTDFGWLSAVAPVAFAFQNTPEQPAGRDPFTPERRFEQRFPGAAPLLPAFMPGYAHTPAAAALLSFLEAHFEINPRLAEAIRALVAAI